MNNLKNAAVIFMSMKKSNQAMINTANFFENNEAINSSMEEKDYDSMINELIRCGLLEEISSGNNKVTCVSISEKGKHLVASSLNEIVQFIQK